MRGLKSFSAIILSVALTTLLDQTSFAQHTEIPTLQICNRSKIDIRAKVRIVGIGEFGIVGKAACGDSTNWKPVADIGITNFAMDGMPLQGGAKLVQVHQVSVAGKTPNLAFVSGDCVYSEQNQQKPCRMWLSLGNNTLPGKRGTVDMIGFLIVNMRGVAIAHGIGEVVDGDVRIDLSGG